jgi:hypothetical protein
MSLKMCIVLPEGGIPPLVYTGSAQVFPRILWIPYTMEQTPYNAGPPILLCTFVPYCNYNQIQHKHEYTVYVCMAA